MDELLNCSVCLERFNHAERRPKVLSCGHTFCLSCLEDMNHGTNSFCPEDRKPFDKLPGNTTDNYMILRFLDASETLKPPEKQKFWCVECVTIANKNCGKHNTCKIQFAPPEHVRLIDDVRNRKVNAARQMEFEVSEIQKVIEEHDRLLAFLVLFEERIKQDVEKLESKKLQALQTLRTVLNLDELQLKESTKILNGATCHSAERVQSLSRVKNTFKMPGVYSLSGRSVKGSLTWQKRVGFACSKKAAEQEGVLQLLLYVLTQHNEISMEWNEEQQVCPAKFIPDTTLRVLLSYLPLEGVVSFGQVCQKWRAVAKQEAVWCQRKLSVSADEKVTIARVLHFAPCISSFDVSGCASVETEPEVEWEEDVINAPCRVRGLRVKFGKNMKSAAWCMDLLKRHAPYLEDLHLERFPRSALEVVDQMKELHRIVLVRPAEDLQFNPFVFQNRSEEQSTLLHLDALKCTAHATVNSLIGAHQFSLQVVKMFSGYHLNTQVKLCSLKELVTGSCNELNQCCQLGSLEFLFPRAHLFCMHHSSFYCRGRMSCEMPPRLALLYPGKEIVCKNHTGMLESTANRA